MEEKQKFILGKWILTFYKYLRNIPDSAEKAIFETTELVGKSLSYAYRLKGLERIDWDKASNIALDIGIGVKTLIKDILPILKKHNFIDYLTNGNNIEEIYEYVYNLEELTLKAYDIWQSESPNKRERIGLLILFLVSLRPHSESEILENLVKQGFEEQDINIVLDILHTSFKLVQKIKIENESYFFNEFYWGSKPEKYISFIRRLSKLEKAVLDEFLSKLLEEQLQPIDELLDEIKSDIENLIKIGFVEPIKIYTKSGDAKLFIATPHIIGEDFKGVLGFDLMNEIKIFTASIIYGHKFSPDYKIRDPRILLERLLERGKIGPATPIGRDYPLLEKLGIIKVEEAANYKNRFYMILNKDKDYVVKGALNILSKQSILDAIGEITEMSGLFVAKRADEPEVVKTERRLKSPIIPSELLEEEILKTIRGEEL